MRKKQIEQQALLGRGERTQRRFFRAAGFFCAGGERFKVAWGGATLVPPRERRIGNDNLAQLLRFFT